MDFYTLQSSLFGTLGLVWRDGQEGPIVYRVFLPNEQTPTENLIRQTFADAIQRSCPGIAELSGRIRHFLEGGDVRFALDMIALDQCPDFQQRVLRAERGIPRGWVSYYGRIARHLGVPGGARAVGNALASNPFPIVIPCHRAIRSDGELGGFQGGLKMKRSLLGLEGIEISPSGKVLTQNVYY